MSTASSGAGLRRRLRSLAYAPPGARARLLGAALRGMRRRGDVPLLAAG
jgi:hypothetical protein